MRLRHLLATASLALAALSAHADVKPVPNPCGLFTEQEASALLGAPAKILMKMDAAGICMFGDAKGNPVISVQGSFFDNANDANENFQNFARMTRPQSLQAVSGLGDHAQTVATQQGDIMLVVQKQNKMLMLSLLHAAGPNLAARAPALTQAGKQATARL